MPSACCLDWSTRRYSVRSCEIGIGKVQICDVCQVNAHTSETVHSLETGGLLHECITVNTNLVRKFINMPIFKFLNQLVVGNSHLAPKYLSWYSDILVRADTIPIVSNFVQQSYLCHDFTTVLELLKSQIKIWILVEYKPCSYWPMFNLSLVLLNRIYMYLWIELYYFPKLMFHHLTCSKSNNFPYIVVLCIHTNTRVLKLLLCHPLLALWFNKLKCYYMYDTWTVPAIPIAPIFIGSQGMCSYVIYINMHLIHLIHVRSRLFRVTSDLCCLVWGCELHFDNIWWWQPIKWIAVLVILQVLHCCHWQNRCVSVQVTIQ